MTEKAKGVHGDQPPPIPDNLRKGEKPLPEHSPLAPSAAHRWMSCPGSVKLAGEVPEGESSEYADLGTAAHDLAARCLSEGTDAWEHAGETITVGEREFVVDEDMTTAVQVHLDEVRRLVDELEPDHFAPEVRFHARELYEACYGTSDAPVVGKTKLAVVDYKHGAGVVVEPEWNEQLLIYAAGVVSEFAREDNLPAELEEIELVVVQPRAHHEGGPVRRWSLTLDQLGEWIEAILLPAVRKTEAEDAPLSPGDHCRFCPAKITCPARWGELDDMDPEEPADGLSDEELATRLDKLASLATYYTALQDEAFTRLMQGKTIPGRKLVRKQSARVWKDGVEDKVVEKFGDEAWEKKLVTPPKAEKLRGGKKFVSEHAYKPDTGLTIAAEDDKRPAVDPRTADEAFADVTFDATLTKEAPDGQD